MIGSVRGTLLERLPSGEVLVEVSGIGYRVIVAPSTAASLGETGSKVFLHTHHHRREDAETPAARTRAGHHRRAGLYQPAEHRGQAFTL